MNLVNPYRFASPFVAHGATFDGSTQYMTLTSSGPTGLADGHLVSFSALFRRTTNATDQTLFWLDNGSNSIRFTIHISTDNKIYVRGRNSTPADVLDIGGSTAISAGSTLHHLYGCFDLTDNAKRKIYLDGVAETLSVTTYDNAGTIKFTNTGVHYRVGAANAVNAWWAGDIGMFWLDDIYLDSPAMFYSGGIPLNPGATGTGAVFYLNGSGDLFATNSGTGGDFTVSGSPLGTPTFP